MQSPEQQIRHTIARCSSLKMGRAVMAASTWPDRAKPASAPYRWVAIFDEALLDGQQIWRGPPSDVDGTRRPSTVTAADAHSTGFGERDDVAGAKVVIGEAENFGPGGPGRHLIAEVTDHVAGKVVRCPVMPLGASSRR